MLTCESLWLSFQRMYQDSGQTRQHCLQHLHLTLTIQGDISSLYSPLPYCSHTSNNDTWNINILKMGPYYTNKHTHKKMRLTTKMYFSLFNIFQLFSSILCFKLFRQIWSMNIHKIYFSCSHPFFVSNCLGKFGAWTFTKSPLVNRKKTLQVSKSPLVLHRMVAQVEKCPVNIRFKYMLST